jgi:hypothetical protein
MTDDAIETILSERRKTHGDFYDHANITQNIKQIMWGARDSIPWANLSNEHREALEMIAHKMGRILAGNPDINDHWDDIAGYAKLGSNACKPQNQL